MSLKKKILIVDDDEELCKTLTDILALNNYNVHWVGNGNDAIKIISTKNIDIVLLDLLLPGMNGLQVLEQVFKINSHIVIIMMSGHGTIKAALEATRLGAYDWLEKPFEKDRLLLTIRNATEKRTLLQEKDVLLSEVKEKYRMVGTSNTMKKIYSLIDKVAPQNTSILITGESGTGKELIARAIHMNSRRAAAHFIRMNCASIPVTLIESELFGHKKGAFTGALKDKKGKFQLADGGTLLMDEIGDLSLSAQAKVLRTIESGEVVMVGTEKIENVDVRVISATNKNLQDLIENGSFREDLYHRINVIEIRIPPLRERTDDIIPITNYFLEMYSSQNNSTQKELTPGAEAALISYSWPGNVRELRNLIEKITVLIDAEKINGQQISNLLKYPNLENEIDTGKSFKMAKESFEKSYIRQALSMNSWNITKTAKSLDIPRSLLYVKIDKYKIKELPKKLDN